MSGPSRVRVRHPVRWVALAVLAALIAVAVVAATRPANTATAVQSPLAGKAAPGFSQRSLSGATVTLSSYRGRYVVVNFFASWCTPCRVEEPNLARFAFEQSRIPGGVALVGVVFDDPDSAARQFLSTFGATWPAVTDPGGVIASAYGVTAPPTTFLVSPSGSVVAEDTGPVTVGQLDRLVAEARRHAT